MRTAQNSRHRQIHNRLICLLFRSIRSIHGHLLTTASPSSLLLRSQEMNWKVLQSRWEERKGKGPGRGKTIRQACSCWRTSRGLSDVTSYRRSCWTVIVSASVTCLLSCRVVWSRNLNDKVDAVKLGYIGRNHAHVDRPGVGLLLSMCLIRWSADPCIFELTPSSVTAVFAYNDVFMGNKCSIYNCKSITICRTSCINCSSEFH